MRKTLISMALLGAIFSVPANASGIPVFDGANALNMAQQLIQLREQYMQLQQTTQALKGINNLGDLFNNPAIRNYMPTDLQGAYDEASSAIYSGQSGSYKGLDGAIDAIEDAARARATWEKMNEAQNQKAVLDVAMMQASYKGAIERLDGIDQLMKKIGRTPTAKESADLTARISAEQTLLQSETNRINLLVAMQGAQDRLMESERKSMAKKAISSSTKGMPSF